MANALVCEPNRFAFAEPRVPSLEVCVPLVLGERVVWIPDDNSGPEHGTVRWMGKLPEMGQDWVAGVELDNPAGKHDGRWANRQLFLTKPKHGLIIPIMGLIKEEEFIGHSHITDSSPQQIVRGLPPDPPGWYDNIEYHNAHRAKSESQFWKRLRSKKGGKGESKKRQPQPESAALQVAASIAAGDVPTAVTPRSKKAKSQTVRSDLGVELEKWYEAADFSDARQCKKKSNTLIGSSSVTSFVDDTEISSLASYGTAADEGSGKLKGSFLSFFRWLRPKKSSKKKPTSSYAPSPSLSEGSRVKSGSVHSVTSTSSSFQYVAMDFSQSRSVSNAPTLEAKPQREPKGLQNKKKSSDEKQHSAGMMSVMNELRVKLTPSSNSATLKSETKVDKQEVNELTAAHKAPNPSEAVEEDKTLVPADEVLVDADYANVSPHPKARSVCVRRKKRRAPPPPPVLLKSGDGSKKTETSGSAVKLNSACASPSPRRGAHVKGKRRAPSPPLQSTPKPWARVKDGKKITSGSGTQTEVKAGDSNTAKPAVVESINVPGSADPPKTVDAETNTTLFRGVATVAVSTNTTLNRPQEDSAISTPLSVNVSSKNKESSKGPLSCLEEIEGNQDIPFCDEEKKDGPEVGLVEEVDVREKNVLAPCVSCGRHLVVDTSKLGTAHTTCPNCSPKIVHIGNSPRDTSSTSKLNLDTIPVKSSDSMPEDEDAKLNNPVVTEEWKETPRSTQNLISMFNAMSYCFEADKWHTPGTTAGQATSEPDKLKNNSSASTCKALAATTIIEELDDEKWLANVDAEFARLSDTYMQTGDRDSKGESMHEMTFSEICSNSSHRATPEPSTSGDTQSLESVIANNSKADLHKKPLHNELHAEDKQAKEWSSIDSLEETSKGSSNLEEHLYENQLPQLSHEKEVPHGSVKEDKLPKTDASVESVKTTAVCSNVMADVHEKMLPDEVMAKGKPTRTWHTSESYEGKPLVNSNFDADIGKTRVSSDSINELEQIKTWSSLDSFEDARDTMTPSLQDYPNFDKASSKSGNMSEESLVNHKEKELNSYEVNNPVYSNIPLVAHSIPTPAPRRSEVAKSNIVSSNGLYQNVCPENADFRRKGGENWKDRTNNPVNSHNTNFHPLIEEFAREKGPAGMHKTYGNPMYANVDVDWRNQKELQPTDCEMFQEEKRMQSRLKMNRRIFKEAKSRNRSSSQESEPGATEANHTGDISGYYRRNRSVSASSSSSPILSSASSVSSALNSPPALPKKVGPIRERRRRSHPVPATISEDSPPKAVKNKSHLRENSGLMTLPSRMPSTALMSSSSVEDIDENKGVLVGSLRLQIASKDGPQPSGLSLVTGCSLPRDSGNSLRAPIPIPDKKSRKKHNASFIPPSVVPGQHENTLSKELPQAVVMRRRKEHGIPARINEQRRTVGSHLPGQYSSNVPCSVQSPDEHEYYNIRVHTGEGCKLQVRRAHTMDSKASSGHHHHHRHPNPRGREKRGRHQKSFASVATDSPLGKVNSRASDSERESSMSDRVTTPDSHCPTPTNAPLSPHPPSNPGSSSIKYRKSLSDPDPISLSQNDSTTTGFQNERSSKVSRLQGSRPGKTTGELLPANVGKQSEPGVMPKRMPHPDSEKLNDTVSGNKRPDILTSNAHSAHHHKANTDPNARSPPHRPRSDYNKSENNQKVRDLDVINTQCTPNESSEHNHPHLPHTGVYGRLTCKLSSNDNPAKDEHKPAGDIKPPKVSEMREKTLPNNNCASDLVNRHHLRHQIQHPQHSQIPEKVHSPKSPPLFKHEPAAASPKTTRNSPQQEPASVANNSLSRSPKMIKADPAEQLPAVVVPDGFHPSPNVALKVCDEAKFAGRLWPASYEIVAPELLRLRSKLSGIANGPQHEEFSDDTNTFEVNKLLRKLEVSIATGHIDEAAGLARQLAMLKVNCSVVRNKPRVDDNASEEICLNLFVEDRTSHIGPINLYVNPSMTVGDLKKKIENNFDFPSNLQRWILGKKLASDDSVPLSEFDIHTNGCTVFLYLMTTDIDIASAYKQRLESYLKALEDLDLEDDFSDDEVTSHFQSEEEANFNVLSGDHSRTACIPTDQRNGHDGSEGSLSQPNNSRKLRHSAEALEMVYAGARPKQLQNDVTSRTQENMIKKEEGWNCPACTMLNLPTRPGCEMCATARPENYIIPKEYVPKPEEEERLRKERQLEIELEQTREKERLENYQRLLAIDDMDVVLNDEAFECPVCFTDIDVGEGIRIRDCLHVFCRDCLAHAVEYSETAEVKCPFRDNDYSCPNVLQHREIQALVTQEVYDRHLQKSVTTAESQAENSFHCKTANCLAWCYFEDNINEFPCPICDHVNCLTCQAIHEEMNCKQYQDKVEFEAATNDAARKTKEALDEMLTKGQAMRCPKCQVILMKKWGCDWICCSMCKTEICWVTKGHRWGPAGQGDTSAGCRCGVNGVRCHAQCNYCH